jgi:transposase-like protein
MDNQTASDGMLQQLVELISIVLRSEPLDTEIERRCNHAWEQAPCPSCEETTVQSTDDSPRVWCGSCRCVFTYTRNTPFEGRTLTLGEVVIACVRYADTLLSINQIAYTHRQSD